jgi:carboxyl-terminal processing protease
MKFEYKKIISIILLLVVAFTLGYGFAIYRYGFSALPITRFTIGTIKNNYIEDIEDEKIARGIVQSLGDPFSVYLTEDEYKSFQTNISNNYVGVGIIITKINEKIKIVRVLNNSPAERAGITKGSEITKVNGIPTNGKDLESISSLIRGPENSEVTLTIINGTIEKDFTLKREKIEIKTVDGEMIAPGIAYIRIISFNMGTDKEFNKILNSLLKESPKGLILDLRDNGGGILEVTANIAKRFLQDGMTLFYIKEKNKEPQPQYINGCDPINIPTMVIVNKGSASASEVLAGAIKDNKVGRIIGEETFGKATIQRMFNVPFSGGAIKLTIQKYLTPDKHDLSSKGLKPDIFFSDLSSNINPKNDNVIKKAISLLTEN